MERFAAPREMRVRIEERIVGENEFPVPVFDFDADLLPDFHRDRTAGKRRVEPRDGAGRVVQLIA